MSHPESETQPAGDWKNCFRELAPRLVLYARQFVDSVADAEDVVQMAFVRWWHRYPDGDRTQVPLLYAAVRTISLDMRRKDMRRILREAKSDVFVESENEPFFDASVEQRERAEIVAEAMRGLPEASSGSQPKGPDISRSAAEQRSPIRNGPVAKAASTRSATRA